MIRYIKHPDIDSEKWDNCIAKSVNGLFYATASYLDIVCDSWDALVENDYESVFPLTYSRKGGITYLFQPPFCQQLGLFSTTMPDQEKLLNFLKHMPSHFRFAEINLNKFNCLENSRYSTRMMINYELDLMGSHEQLWAGYSENHRRNIEKALTAGLMVQEAGQPETIISLFRNNKGKSLSYYTNAHYRKLQHLVYHFIQKGRADVITVRNKTNELLGGAFLLLDEKRIVFLFSGRDMQAVEPGVMHLLLDHCIGKYAGMQMVFDFEGSNEPGLARFYAGFGSIPSQYIHLCFNHLPLPVKILLTVAKRITRM